MHSSGVLSWDPSLFASITRRTPAAILVTRITITSSTPSAIKRNQRNPTSLLLPPHRLSRWRAQKDRSSSVKRQFAGVQANHSKSRRSRLHPLERTRCASRFFTPVRGGEHLCGTHPESSTARYMPHRRVHSQWQGSRGTQGDIWDRSHLRPTCYLRVCSPSSLATRAEAS